MLSSRLCCLSLFLSLSFLSHDLLLLLKLLSKCHLLNRFLLRWRTTTFCLKLFLCFSFFAHNFLLGLKLLSQRHLWTCYSECLNWLWFRFWRINIRWLCCFFWPRISSRASRWGWRRSSSWWCWSLCSWFRRGRLSWLARRGCWDSCLLLSCWRLGRSITWRPWWWCSRSITSRRRSRCCRFCRCFCLFCLLFFSHSLSFFCSSFSLFFFPLFFNFNLNGCFK